MLLFIIMCSEINVKIDAITPPIQHAEGPHWDHNNHILYYVDTFQSTAIKFDPKTKHLTSHKFDNRNSIGIIIPLANKKNEFLVGADRFLEKFSWNGKRNNSGVSEVLAMVDENKPNNQFNDGKVDAKGRLWVGTLWRNEDNSVTPYGGALYKVDAKLQIENEISNTSISNGLAWSSNNKYFYYIDSETRTVVRFDFDVQVGKIKNRKIIFDLKDHENLHGIPDGMTIDCDDNLWIALFGGGAIIKVNPLKGTLEKIVKMPVKYVTSAAFGGDDFATLYVTTSKLKLNETELEEEPLAGCVFAVTNLKVKGLPANYFLL